MKEPKKHKGKIFVWVLFLLVLSSLVIAVVWANNVIKEKIDIIEEYEDASEEYETIIDDYASIELEQKEEIEELQLWKEEMEELNEELISQNQEMTELIAELTKKGNGIEGYGQLSVKDGQLVSEQGQKVMLRGLSSHGLQWYPEYTNASAMATLKEYGANVFRIAMYTEQNGSYSEDPEMNKFYMYMAIENVLSQDMYVIVDWHVLRDENPLVYMDEAIAFFDEISAHYSDEEGIIYEICNEPNGDTTWEDIKTYADEVIPVIRKNSPESIIIVGTPRYSRELGEAIEDPLEYENIMYSYHKYINLAERSHFNSDLLEEAKEAQIAVFVSEWGLSYDDDIPYEEVLSKDDERLHWTAAYEFIEYLKDNNISWCGWALSSSEEDHAFLWPDCEKLSEWSTEDLTPNGWFFRYALQELKE